MNKEYRIWIPLLVATIAYIGLFASLRQAYDSIIEWKDLTEIAVWFALVGVSSGVSGVPYTSYDMGGYVDGYFVDDTLTFVRASSYEKHRDLIEKIKSL